MCSPIALAPYSLHFSDTRTVGNNMDLFTLRVGIGIQVQLSLHILVFHSLSVKVVLENYFYFCVRSFKFIPLDKRCDGTEDCIGGEDETRCVQRFTVSSSPIVRFSEQSSALLVFVRSTNMWSWVCSDNWDSTKAKAVCAQVGFTRYVPPTHRPVINISLEISLSSPAHLLLLFSFCVACGSSNKQTRIIGGNDSPIENWPWTVSLQYMGQHLCGASVLNSYWLLTAAHCFKALIPFGSNGITCDRFPGWGPTLLGCSPSSPVAGPAELLRTIYLFILSFSASVQPICLPGIDISLPPSAVFWVTGWGDTTEGGSKEILFTSVIQIDNAYGQIPASMLCAGKESGGADTCQGDSGGPLVYYADNSRWEQVGIVSFGNGCGRPRDVGVYSNISAFLDWVYAAMKSELNIIVTLKEAQVVT
uniref:Uncharacterized protein n=1 Tax=Leptobrachium leishanense TaxID=445787 RepID=A0A8C5R8A3_9ANUR